MYIHLTKIIGDSNASYPSWMSFRNRVSDPLNQYFTISNEMVRHSYEYIKTRTSLSPTFIDYTEPSSLYSIPSYLSGTYIGDGNQITRCANNEDFLSPIPTRISFDETISLPVVPESKLFSVCYIDSISGEFVALGHSGIYTYNLTGSLIDRDVYNLSRVSEEILYFDPYGVGELSYFPLSGSLHVTDIYNQTDSLLPNSQFAVSGQMLYARWLSGVYMADYNYLVYHDETKLKTFLPNHEISNQSTKMFVGTEFGSSYNEIDFELEHSSLSAILIADPRIAKPGSNAIVEFDYMIHHLKTWPDSRFDYRISPISGEYILPESIRVYSTGSNGETPLYLKAGNIYHTDIGSATPIYPEEVDLESTTFHSTLLSGVLTAGTIYISYYAQYEKTYTISGQQSYYPSTTLSVAPSPTRYTIEDGIVWPKTIYTVTESSLNIGTQLSSCKKENIRLKIPNLFTGICKRYSAEEVWVSTIQRVLYENKTGGREVHFSTSNLLEDVVPLYSRRRVDSTWSKCFLKNGAYSLTDTGGAEAWYYKFYPFANMDCAGLKIIGMLSVDEYLLVVLRTGNTILLVYYDPDKSGMFDVPDVIEFVGSFTDPKDCFLFNKKLYILDQNQLKVYDLFHDYMISFPERSIFREQYSQVVG